MVDQTAFPVCPTSLSEEQVRQYWDQGYLAFQSGLSASEVAEAREAISAMVSKYANHPERSDFQAPSGDEGNYAGACFRSRYSEFLMQLEAGYDPVGKDAAAIEDRVRKFMWFEDEAPVFQSLYRDHPRIIGVIRSLFSQELDLYQCMGLIKPAKVGSEKPWHQDNAYFKVEDLDKTIGVWIALDDATIENGCMFVLEAQHRRGPLKHEMTTLDCEIAKDRIEPAQGKPIELKAGGVLFFHGNLPHKTPPNRSVHRRRALQYHFRAKDNQLVSKDEFLDVFKEADGESACCYAATQRGF